MDDTELVLQWSNNAIPQLPKRCTARLGVGRVGSGSMWCGVRPSVLMVPSTPQRGQRPRTCHVLTTQPVVTTVTTLRVLRSNVRVSPRPNSFHSSLVSEWFRAKPYMCSEERLEMRSTSFRARQDRHTSRRDSPIPCCCTVRVAQSVLRPK